MFGAGRNLRKIVENSFGQNPLEGFSFYNATDRLKNVRRLHEVIEEPEDKGWLVDEVTWNDLEMDEVFLRINHTNSFIGEQVLYDRLHRLKKPVNKEMVKKLNQDSIKRSELEMKLHTIGKPDNAYLLPEFVLNAGLWTIGNPAVYHTLQILLALSLVLTCFVNEYLLIITILIGCVNFIIYMGVKQKYDVYFSSLIEFKKIYEFCSWLQKHDKEKAFISDDIETCIHKLDGMSKIIIGTAGRHQMSAAGDLAAQINEYMWGVMLVDVAVFNHIMKLISKNQEEVMRLMIFVGEIDAAIAVASYRQSLDRWCKPQFVDQGFSYKGIAHPLIVNPVDNDFSLESRAVITGTNASGKSTFMKSIAINTILAQTIDTCIADEARLCPMRLASCMALRDDILTGESYYFREAKCLKGILDLTKGEDALMIIVDEILKGTNTRERVAASRAILKYLAETSAITIVATHDYELTKNPQYENYHFRSQIKNETIAFDYHLYEGVCQSSNAVELLAYMKYPQAIVDKARSYLNEN